MGSLHAQNRSIIAFPHWVPHVCGYSPPKNSTVTLSVDVCDVPMMLVPFTSTVGAAAWTSQGPNKRNRVAQRKTPEHGGVDRGGMVSDCAVQQQHLYGGGRPFSDE